MRIAGSGGLCKIRSVWTVYIGDGQVTTINIIACNTYHSLMTKGELYIDAKPKPHVVCLLIDNNSLKLNKLK